MFSQEYLNGVINALKQGDTKLLSTYFDSELDLTFSEKTNTYSKRQATMIIERFFSKEGPKNYVKVQQGTSNSNNTKFSIGKLYTSNGEFKVYMFFIFKNGKYLLKELRFEK